MRTTTEPAKPPPAQTPKRASKSGTYAVDRERLLDEERRSRLTTAELIAARLLLPPTEEDWS